MSAFLVLSFFSYAAKSDYFELPMYDCSDAKSNYELGYCIGVHTKEQVRSRWEQWTMVQNLYQWINTNQSGKTIYDKFLSNNGNKFPLYAYDEAHGIADGSDFDFEKIFIMTCADEISYFAPPTVLYEPSLACSDYLLQDYDKSNNIINSYMTHNEDNGTPNRNNTYLVKANITNEIPFYSYGYAGEVLTQSGGWNDFIVFTSNFVHPSNPVLGGYCRNFVARTFLIQKTLQNGLDKSAIDGQCAGHNYQFGEFISGNSADSEVAYDSLHAFTDITNEYEWTFHANMYIHLNISQYPSTSSVARENTAKILGKPSDLNDMLNYLGDESNSTYPIYKTGRFADYTLHTISVDLFKGQIDIFADNPKQKNKLYGCSVNIGGKNSTPSSCR